MHTSHTRILTYKYVLNSMQQEATLNHNTKTQAKVYYKNQLTANTINSENNRYLQVSAALASVVLTLEPLSNPLSMFFKHMKQIKINQSVKFVDYLKNTHISLPLSILGLISNKSILYLYFILNYGGELSNYVMQRLKHSSKKMFTKSCED